MINSAIGRSALILVLILLSSCGESHHRIVVAGGAEGSSFLPAGKELGELWNEEHVADVKVESGPQHTPKRNVADLIAGKADLALSQNDITVTAANGGSAIRTILPLYPEILYIIYRDTIQASSLEELMRGRRVAFGPRESGTAVLMAHLLARFGIDSSEYHPMYVGYKSRTLSDSIDVCCALTGFNNPVIEEMLTRKHGKLFSLDTFELKELRGRAFEQLIQEELAADESFRILMSIIDDTIAAVAGRRAELAG